MGSIMAFGFDFAPRGWYQCNGQLISIAQNTALFSLLGTYYGGDGVNTFALPDLRGHTAIGIGQGKGTSNYVIGQQAGEETHTLTTYEMPQHNHLMTASADGPTQATAQGASLGSQGRTGGTMPVVYANGITAPVPMASATTPMGGSQAHNNMQPYLAVNYCIAAEGIYPQRP